MSDKKDELERLARLRDRQLQSRDPHAKQKKTQSVISQQWQKQKKITLRDMANNLSYTVKGAVIGALAGIAIWIVLALVLTSSWVDLAGLAASVILAVLGVVIGQGFDAREEMKDVLKRW